MSIATLVAQHYAGDIRVTVVDEASNDGPAVLAKTAAFRVARCNRLTVVRSRAFESPWTGKLNAALVAKSRYGEPRAGDQR